MKAICFECGKEKSAAIKMCSHCKALPIKRREKIVSFCLSAECLTQRNLLFSQNHIFRQGRPPGFRATVIRAAMAIVDQLPDDLQVANTEITEVFEVPEAALVE